MAAATALCELLDEELAYDATTVSHLTNHLPMALVAIERLGADDDRLRAFSERYQHRLVPVEPAEPIGSFDEWRAARGRRGVYGAARGFLDDAVDRHGQDAVVRRCLPELVDGIGGGAFHGVIRLAYALEVQRPARVAAGLAYLTQVYTPLGERGAGGARTDDPVAALVALRGDAELVAAAGEGNIGQRMAQVAAHPGFRGVVDWLAVDEATPSRLVGAATALYAVTDDFTALHGVTGSHAITILQPYVEDREQLCACWFQALAAAYLTIGAPALSDPTEALGPWLDAPPSWEEVAAAGAADDDEHVGKLVYSCRELDRLEDDPALLACAARQARVPPQVGR